jgi:hypothetical protein
LLPNVRLFGTDGEEIRDLDSWFAHAPPEKAEEQWKDGYSAKEQAKAWLRPERPAVPEELWAALAPFAERVDEIYGRPEHKTSLDRFGRKRQHDLFACARTQGQTRVVIGVEAKACEDFDGTVGDRAVHAPPSNRRARCNLLSRALFGREVMDEATGEILDAELATHGYQLWTAAVGTIIEAQQRKIDDVVLIVHQFAPRDLHAAKSAGDKRQWKAALEANEASFESFVSALVAAGGRSHETDLVRPGSALNVIKVESPITD